MASHIEELYTKLIAERDAIHQQLAPLYQKAEALRAQVQPLEAELRGVQAQIKDAEHKAGLRGIVVEAGKLARLLDTSAKPRRTLTVESGTVTATPSA